MMKIIMHTEREIKASSLRNYACFLVKECGVPEDVVEKFIFDKKATWISMDIEGPVFITYEWIE